VEKTLFRLRSLGNQTFGLFPFNEYFDDWLLNLRSVLSDFESSSAISADEQFVKECSQILSNVGGKLDGRRSDEAAHDRAVKSLLDDRSLLERIREEYITRNREIEVREKSETKRLSRNIQDLKEELDRLAQMKTSIFRSFSKRARERKETEITKELNFAQGELQSALRNFTAEQDELRGEYEKRKRSVAEHIENLQKEIENLEVDGSLEVRLAACEALVNAINALLKRKTCELH
jgi:chromosome segregation ATPase